MAMKEPREGALEAGLTVARPGTNSVGFPGIAKSVAKEATRRRLALFFFAEHSVVELREDNDFWLGRQGRLTHAILLDGGATHHRPGGRDEAFGDTEEPFRCIRLQPWAGPVIPQLMFQAERIP